MKRINFAPTVLDCLTALTELRVEEWFDTLAKEDSQLDLLYIPLTLLLFRTDKLDMNKLVSPKEVVHNYHILDAELTNEHLYLGNLLPCEAFKLRLFNCYFTEDCRLTKRQQDFIGNLQRCTAYLGIFEDTTPQDLKKYYDTLSLEHISIPCKI